jgi:hypothetical protein
MRGYSPFQRVDDVVASNGELAASVIKARPSSMVPSVHITAFGDAAYGRLQGSNDTRTFADAGVGILARDQLWDRRVTLRFDVPLYVRYPALAPGGNLGDDRVKLRWTFSFADLW